MAGYLLYFPKMQANASGYMHQVGLGSLLVDGSPMFADVHRGPDGGSGVVAWWDDPRRPDCTPSTGYVPTSQDWEQCKPGKSYESGAFWLGKERSRPPTPKDLMRPKVHQGMLVTLADGNEWLIAVAKYMPTVFALDDRGEQVALPKPAYREFFDRAMYAVEHWLIPGSAELPYLEGTQLAVMALEQNYRLNWEIAHWLGLFGRDEIFDAIWAACGIGVREKKTGKSTSVP